MTLLLAACGESRCVDVGDCGAAQGPTLDDRCVWRTADGAVATNFPTRGSDGVWRWPDGTASETQWECQPMGTRDAGPAQSGASNDSGVPDAVAAPDAARECRSAVDCGDARGRCSAEGRCVECLEVADCPASSPRCSALGRCEACESAEDCGHIEDLPECDTESGMCVACLTTQHCTDATASRCDDDNLCQPCQEDADCSHIEGKTICDGGECVECTGAKFTPCGESEGEPLVCDSLARTCSAQTQGDRGLCQSCVSDAACRPGQLCVLQRFGMPDQEDVGYFCLWKQGDTDNGAPADCFLGGQPFAETFDEATSIDGETADVCDLAVSTCVSYNQFRSKDCAPAGTPDHALCGFAGGIDGRCEPVSASAHRCTMRCGTDEDCRSGFACNTGVSPAVCEL